MPWESHFFIKTSSSKVSNRSFFEMDPSTDAPTPAAVSVTDSTIRTLHDQQMSSLVESTNNRLLQIVRRHFNTKYATQAPSLSVFRDAVAAHGGIRVDATLLADFRAHVPLSDYEFYRPFADRFDIQPCKKEDVENLFAPGFPDFLASSSSTTGKAPKLLARYTKAGPAPRHSQFFDRKSKKPLAAVVYCGCMSVREIVDASGQVVKKIPVSLSTSGRVRTFFGWEFEDDESRMSVRLPYYAVPWAATTIGHIPSFLIIHGLFFLTRRDVDRFYVPFASLFVDLMCYIEKQWDMLVSCINDGILPELEGIDHVREHLQAQLHADPERAAELLEMGPPFSFEGWASRVWPHLRELCTVSSGPWVMMLPKVRSILGPNVFISSIGYGATESDIGLLHDPSKPDEFILPSDKVIEFLDVSQVDALENLCQAWEVEVRKQYEPVITTVHGLWRYRMGDIVTIIGFHPQRHSPIFKFFGRKSMKIHLPHTQITDFHLLEALRVSCSEDTILAQEFTTVMDDRASGPPTVGYFVELAKPAGLNAPLAPQRLFDTLVAIGAERQQTLAEDGNIRLPTIRIVKPGTFSEYRLRRAKTLNINSAQIKIPVVLGDKTLQEWLSKRVIQEL